MMATIKGEGGYIQSGVPGRGEGNGDMAWLMYTVTATDEVAGP